MRYAMQTYESAEWLYNHRDTLAAGESRPSCMVTGVYDMPGQIAGMRAQGYVVHGITVHTYCRECQGSGRVPKRNTRSRFAWKSCPSCKGHEGALHSTPYGLIE